MPSNNPEFEDEALTDADSVAEFASATTKPEVSVDPEPEADQTVRDDHSWVQLGSGHWF